MDPRVRCAMRAASSSSFCILAEKWTGQSWAKRKLLCWIERGEAGENLQTCLLRIATDVHSGETKTAASQSSGKKDAEYMHGPENLSSRDGPISLSLSRALDKLFMRLGALFSFRV